MTKYRQKNKNIFARDPPMIYNSDWVQSNFQFLQEIIFPMKSKSSKMLRTMQVTFLPGLVPTGDSGL